MVVSKMDLIFLTGTTVCLYICLCVCVRTCVCVCVCASNVSSKSKQDTENKFISVKRGHWQNPAFSITPPTDKIIRCYISSIYSHLRNIRLSVYPCNIAIFEKPRFHPNMSNSYDEKFRLTLYNYNLTNIVTTVTIQPSSECKTYNIYKSHIRTHWMQNTFNKNNLPITFDKDYQYRKQ